MAFLRLQSGNLKIAVRGQRPLKGTTDSRSTVAVYKNASFPFIIWLGVIFFFLLLSTSKLVNAQNLLCQEVGSFLTSSEIAETLTGRTVFGLTKSGEFWREDVGRLDEVNPTSTYFDIKGKEISSKILVENNLYCRTETVNEMEECFRVRVCNSKDGEYVLTVLNTEVALITSRRKASTSYSEIVRQMNFDDEQVSDRQPSRLGIAAGETWHGFEQVRIAYGTSLQSFKFSLGSNNQAHMKFDGCNAALQPTLEQATNLTFSRDEFKLHGVHNPDTPAGWCSGKVRIVDFVVLDGLIKYIKLYRNARELYGGLAFNPDKHRFSASQARNMIDEYLRQRSDGYKRWMARQIREKLSAFEASIEADLMGNQPLHNVANIRAFDQMKFIEEMTEGREIFIEIEEVGVTDGKLLFFDVQHVEDPLAELRRNAQSWRAYGNVDVPATINSGEPRKFIVVCHVDSHHNLDTDLGATLRMFAKLRSTEGSRLNFSCRQK